MAENSINLNGRLTRSPELTTTRKGTARAHFTIASNRRWRNRETGAEETSTSFVRVVCFGEQAHNVIASFETGHRVVVTGRIEHRTWDDDDSNHREITEIVADEVAASVRWATVEITKVTDRDEPGPAAGSHTEADPTTNPDEEPF